MVDIEHLKLCGQISGKNSNSKGSIKRDYNAEMDGEFLALPYSLCETRLSEAIIIRLFDFIKPDPYCQC